MASIIPGYEYDIFISYRQKDNKYDGWVTEFIDHLKREIEATFKEDVTIYFDENPHDGLLEIHNVDKSLETKLKSLIFMPVISQTYCDPKSFAWQNEFVAFNKIASADPIGRDIKLASGNVCSRIIPVKIHELDASDTELIENEMGCRLRAIEFIYSSAGVNRPLKPADNPDKNLNKTYYRDQINKVANAIKEVIYSVHPDEKKRPVKSYQTRDARNLTGEIRQSPERKPTWKGYLTTKTVMLSVLAVIIVAAGIVFIPKLFNKSQKELTDEGLIRKAIAILPVSNLTGDPDLQYIADGIHVDMNTMISGIGNLIVRPAQTTLQFMNSIESIQEIAKKLSVNTLIISSIKGSKDNLTLNVQLAEAFPQDRTLWSSAFKHTWENCSDTYKEIISHIITGTNTKITSQEAGNLKISRKHDPALLEAYKLGSFYINQLSEDDFRKGVKYLNEAMAIDPTDPLPYLGLALGYGNSAHAYGISPDAPEKAKAYAEKALDLDSTIAEAHVVLGTRNLYTDWNFTKARYHLLKALEYNPSSPDAHAHYAWYLTLVNKIDQAVAEMKRAAEIDPLNPFWQGYISWLHLWYGNYEDALKEAQKTMLLRNNYPMGCYVMGLAYSGMGMHNEAIEAHKRGLDNKTGGINYSSGFISGLGVSYAKAGMRNEALQVATEMEKQNNYWHTWGLADIYVALGDYGKALDNIEAAFKARHDFFPWFKVSSSYKDIFNNPRFKEITGRITLPSD